MCLIDSVLAADGKGKRNGACGARTVCDIRIHKYAWQPPPTNVLAASIVLKLYSNGNELSEDKCAPRDRWVSSHAKQLSISIMCKQCIVGKILKT